MARPPPPRAPLWVAVYGVTSMLLGALPLLALGVGLAVIALGIRGTAIGADGGRYPRTVDAGGDAGRGAGVRSW